MLALDYAKAEVMDTQLQHAFLKIINDHVFNVDHLRKFCPLDHGRHAHVLAIQTLRDIDKLPIELLHHFLGEVNVQFF